MQISNRRIVSAISEVLDARRMLTSSLLADGSLAILGTSSDDIISVSQSGASIIVTQGLVNKSYASISVKRIGADLQAGNDKLTIASTILLPASLLGGTGNDTISSGGGNDTIRGGDGNDSLLGNAGNDLVDGQSGVDNLLGGTGDDKFLSGLGNDSIDGWLGNDTVDYSARTTTVSVKFSLGVAGVPNGGKGGQTGVDTDTYLGIETVIGGTGADSFTYEDNLTANGSNQLPTRKMLFVGGTGNDMFQTLSIKNDDGLALITLQGGVGNDTFNIGGGAHVIVIGEAGNDTLNLSRWYQARFVTSVDLGADTDLVKIAETEVQSPQIEYTLPSNTENFDGNFGIYVQQVMIHGNSLDNTITMHGGAFAFINGSIGNDTLLGAGNYNQIDGDEGNDLIRSGAGTGELHGGTGNDTIYGGLSINTILGGDGNDLLYGDNFDDDIQGQAGNDTINGFGGDDTILGGTGDDSIISSAGKDTITGGGDNDTYSAANSTGGVTFTLSTNAQLVDRVKGQVTKVNNQIDTIQDVDVFIGSPFGDLFTLHDVVPTVGGKLAIQFLGLAGDDGFVVDSPAPNAVSSHQVSIYGGAGSDKLYATSPDTIKLWGEAGDDECNHLGGKLPTFIGGADYDHFDFKLKNSGFTQLVYNMESSLESILVEIAGKVTVNGNGLNNRINALVDQCTINGGGGNDNIRAHQGRATVDGGAGNDIIDCSTDSSDSISGGTGNDSILGSPGSDTIYGGDDNDTIKAGLGADSIFGDAGADSIYGGLGNDTITGGTGRDLLYGEEGNDSFYAKDGEIDTLNGDGGKSLINGKDAADFDKIDLLFSVEDVIK